MRIEIDYDGKWPTLCCGNLKVTVKGEVWDFGAYCLSSGGRIKTLRDEDEGSTFITHHGDWSITKWPEAFPEELKPFVLHEIQEQIPRGCCGGCI